VGTTTNTTRKSDSGFPVRAGNGLLGQLASDSPADRGARPLFAAGL